MMKLSLLLIRSPFAKTMEHLFLGKVCLGFILDTKTEIENPTKQQAGIEYRILCEMR